MRIAAGEQNISFEDVKEPKEIKIMHTYSKSKDSKSNSEFEKSMKLYQDHENVQNKLNSIRSKEKIEIKKWQNNKFTNKKSNFI